MNFIFGVSKARRNFENSSKLRFDYFFKKKRNGQRFFTIFDDGFTIARNFLTFLDRLDNLVNFQILGENQITISSRPVPKEN